MKKQVFTFLLIIVLILSSFSINGTAKELDSIAEIAALSKLEPISNVGVNAYAEVTEKKASTLPAKYSSKDLGFTTDVRQQNADTCWAFASLATLESFLLKSGENTEHLSVEHMNIWGTVEDSGLGWQRQDLINDGGYSYIPMGYFTSWSGPLNDEFLPFGSDKIDFIAANKLYSPQYGVTEIRYINRDTPIKTIKSYVMDYGAVVANFNADDKRYMNYTADGFYCSDSSIPSSSLCGHSVSLVGWDDNFPKEHFSTSAAGDTPKQNGAWLIKNSWGDFVNTSDGYFWISYEDVWLFHELFGPSFAITGYIELDKSKNIYQNEIYGATTEFNCLTDEYINPTDTITYINAFDFNGEDSVLDKVLFESTSFGSDYTVYYIPVINNKPTQNSSSWTKLATGTVDYTGYITADINNFDLPEGKGAIGVTIDNTKAFNENKNNPNYKYIPNGLGVCEWLSFNGRYYFKNQGTYGESFVISSQFGDEKMYDLMDFYETYFDDPMGATFVIKAITENPDLVPEIPTTPNTDPTESEATESTTSVEDNTTVSNTTDPAETSLATLPSLPAEKPSAPVVTIPTESTAETSTALETSATLTTETKATEATKAPEIYLLGDVDFSNIISIKDATLISKHLAKLTTLNDIALLLADTDNSGKCTIKDATLIQKYIALIDVTSGVGTPVTLYNN